jgi:hypothetical protein
LKILLVGIFLFLSLWVIADDAEIRTWTSRHGATIEAFFVEESNGVAVLKDDAGKLIHIQIDDLVRVDRDYVLELSALERKAMNEKRAEWLKSSSRRVTTNKADEKPEYLSRFEREVLNENNLARESPNLYVGFIEKYRLKNEGGNVFNTKHGHLMTKEGLVAVDEAIRFLKMQHSLPPIKPSEGLSRAARDHANDIGVANIVGHTGSNGSSSRDRIEKHGKWDVTIGENIQFGQGDARDIIMQLIIDDGVSNRGHRIAIFNRAFKVAGVAIAPHKTYTSCCVIDYAGGFR